MEGIGQELSLQVVIGYLIVTTMEWLKGKNWFPWLTPHTKRVNRAVGAVAAMLYSLGIHYQFDSTAGILVIEGLSLDPIVDGLRGYVLQQLMYRGAVEKTPTEEKAVMKKKNIGSGKKIGALLLVGVLGFGSVACAGKVPVQHNPADTANKRAIQTEIATYADVIQRAGEIVEQGQLIEIAAYRDGYIPQATHVAFQQRLLTASRAVQAALDKAKAFAQTPDVVTILTTALDAIDSSLIEDITKIVNVETRDRIAVYFRGLKSLLDALTKLPRLAGGGDLDTAAAVWQRLDAAALTY